MLKKPYGGCKTKLFFCLGGVLPRCHAQKLHPDFLFPKKGRDQKIKMMRDLPVFFAFLRGFGLGRSFFGTNGGGLSPKRTWIFWWT